MKSIVVRQPHEMIIEDRDLPTPGPDELLIKVKLAGICGSDSHILHGNNPFAKYPRVIGHEFYGVIEAIGSKSQGKSIGQRVCIDPVICCGHCYPCSIGKPNVCTSLSVAGVHRDGGFSEYAVVPSRNAWAIPDDVSDEYACMVEPFSIAANVTSQCAPTERDIALLYGAGPISMTIIQVLKRVYKVGNIIVADPIEERLKMAKLNGADFVINNECEPLPEKLKELDIKPTLIIDGACLPKILGEAITLASPAARIVLMGFSSEPSQIVQQGITSKEISILSSRLNSNKFPTVISWLQKKLIDPSILITHRFNYQKINEAMKLFEEDRKTCCKILITFNS